MAVFEANDNNFDELINAGVCIVDFYATHCGPCRALWPILLGIQSELPFINIVRVNTDSCPVLASRFKIMSLPTLYLCSEGKMQEYHNTTDASSIKQALSQLLYK